MRPSIEATTGITNKLFDKSLSVAAQRYASYWAEWRSVIGWSAHGAMGVAWIPKSRGGLPHDLPAVGMDDLSAHVAGALAQHEIEDSCALFGLAESADRQGCAALCLPTYPPARSANRSRPQCIVNLQGGRGSRRWHHPA